MPEVLNQIPRFTLVDASILVSSQAQYRDAPDPAAILRKGLIDEAKEVFDTEVENTQELLSECGDVIWYAVEASSYFSLNLDGNLNLNDPQEPDHYLALMLSLDDTTEPMKVPLTLEYLRELVGVHALRLVDTLNPSEESTAIWQDNLAKRQSPEEALNDLLYILCKGAFLLSSTPSEMLMKTIQKNNERPRKAHNVEKRTMVDSSDRGRLRIILRHIIASAAADNNVGAREES